MASLGPEQTNTRLCLCRDTLGTFGARVSSLAVYADILVTTQHARVYFLPVSVCDTGPPLSHKEISVAGQKAEPGSGANGYYMDPGRGAGHQPVRDYKLGLRTLGPSLDSFLDSSKCALIILVTHLGRGSNNEPRDRAWTRPRGMSFFLVTGQQ